MPTVSFLGRIDCCRRFAVTLCASRQIRKGIHGPHRSAKFARYTFIAPSAAEILTRHYISTMSPPPVSNDGLSVHGSHHAHVALSHANSSTQEKVCLIGSGNW
jgi:hypothetical protein